MAKKLAEKLNACANCGTPLSGENFCPNCGQKNARPELNLKHFLTESLSNFFAFDNTFFHTTYHLFRYPGRVARDYVEGKRKRYLHPMRTYLVSSFVFIFIFSLGLTGERRIVKMNGEKDALADTISKAEQQQLKNTWNPDSSANHSRSDRMQAFRKMYPLVPVEDALDSLALKNNWQMNMQYDFSTKYATMDGDRFNEYLTSKLLWALFAFVPFLAVWLKLVYIRKGIHYVEHLFFSFYTQAAFFAVLTLSIFAFLISDALQVVIIASFMIYLLLALKNFYQQSWGKTILKFFVINIGYVGIFLLVLALFIVFSYIIY